MFQQVNFVTIQHVLNKKLDVITLILNILVIFWLICNDCVNNYQKKYDQLLCN